MEKIGHTQAPRLETICVSEKFNAINFHLPFTAKALGNRSMPEAAHNRQSQVNHFQQ